MRIVHYWRPVFGEPAGVSAAIADWSAHQAAAGHDVSVLGDGDPACSGQPFAAGVRIDALPHHGRGRMTRVPRGLARRLVDADLLVLHEGFTAHQYAAAVGARRRGIPYVVVPHGVENADWRATMRGEPVRRRAENVYLRQAAAVHVFFDNEVPVVRAVSPSARVLVLPTGIDLPDRTWAGGDRLLWIGRYSVEHKGLDLLLHALAALPRGARPRILLRGYDYAGGVQTVHGLRDWLGLGEWVEIGPPVVDPAEKDVLLRACAGWVQPSRWESHSIALLEALSRGVPALVSDRMPVAADLAAAGAARVTATDVASLAGALADFGAAPDPALGARGREFVHERFNWTAILRRHDVEFGRLVGAGRGGGTITGTGGGRGAHL